MVAGTSHRASLFDPALKNWDYRCKPPDQLGAYQRGFATSPHGCLRVTMLGALLLILPYLLPPHQALPAPMILCSFLSPKQWQSFSSQRGLSLPRHLYFTNKFSQLSLKHTQTQSCSYSTKAVAGEDTFVICVNSTFSHVQL